MFKNNNFRSRRDSDPNQGTRDNNFTIRSFCGGREAESDVDRPLPLNEQRAYVNKQQRGRGRGQRYYNNRRGRKNFNNFNRNRGFASDTESLHSNESQSVASDDGWGDIPVNNDNANNWSQNYCPVSFPQNDDNSKVTNKAFGNEMSRIEGVEDPNAGRRDKLSFLRKMKEEYEETMKALKPMDIIMDCRQDIEEAAKKAIKNNLKNIESITSQLPACNGLKLHLTNLLLQQSQFEDCVASIKSQLSTMYTASVQDLLKYSESMKSKIEREGKLFKRALPGYAYKSDIMGKAKTNNVVLVSADSSYLLNILLPLFAKEDYPQHCILSCETSKVLVERVKRNVFNLLDYPQVEPDEKKKILDADINFLTTEEILNLSSNDYTFDEKNIFAIMTLPLKRSLTSDILLANLKEMLLAHDKSKLVLIVSAYDQISKYQSYFSKGTTLAIVKTPSLILPVKTIWRNTALSPVDDYVENVAKTALAIHTLNEPGDIMAFLPNFADAKSVSAIINEKLSYLQYDDLVCDIIHENSVNKNCLDLWIKQPFPKRRVFLVTDAAELFVIQTVRYVIDSGLKKENSYDPSKKLDILSTAFISHSKARIRKSLCGIFTYEGICFRLYNRENFRREMRKVELPEILTVNPFNSMIKIFQYRPTSAIDTSFVDPLSDSTKVSSLKLLKQYNAVKNDSLTELGKKMVKLPFLPKYSKLILLGITWDLAIEAIVLVAFFSVKGRVFKFSTNPEAQRDIDAIKLQLMQSDSDTISYLYIYKTWLEGGCHDSWCDTHCINFSTLESVQRKVSEIIHTVEESLHETISQEFTSLKQSAPNVLEMLFDCFQDNLCVFTGHYKSGYRVLSSHCIAFLHPSSILCQKEDLPQFILFDHMVSTNRDFLLSITSIPSDFVMKALTDQTIEFDYSDMFEKSLVQRVLEPVGERMIKQVLLGKKGGKLTAIENNIRAKLSTESFVIEPVPENGRVLVYALENQIDEAVRLVNEVLLQEIEAIKNSEKVHIFELKRGQITIPVELKWLKGAKVASVKAAMTSQNPSIIQNNLANSEDSSEQLPCVIQRCINITWVRRPCNGSAFITFKAEDFPAARRLAYRNYKLGDLEFSVQPSKNSKNQLFVTELPSEIKSYEVEEAFSTLLRDVKAEKVELLFKPPFETSQNQLQEIKVQLEELCKTETSLSDFTVKVPPPKNSATLYMAFINVTDENEDIELAAEKLSKSLFLNRHLVCKPVYRSMIKCNLKVATALRKRFAEVLQELKADLLETYSTRDLFEVESNKVNEDIAEIKMLSNKNEILQMVLRTVNHLLEGELLDRNFSNKLSKLFCHGGNLWLRNLEKTSGVYILEDYINKTLRLYGSKENCRYCKQRILDFSDNTDNEAVTQISLSGESKTRKLMKALIQKYKVNLEGFIESCELRSAVLDIKSCVLALHGSRESIEAAEDKLRELAAEVKAFSSASDAISGGELCPVCACSAFNGTRLELCGHLFCAECIEGLVEQALFPIQCCAEDCSKDIILDDIDKILGDDPEKIKSLVEKSMKNYIETHKDQVVCCPAPDCDMFFNKSELSSDKMNCPLCQNDLCLKCNVVYHQGFSCEMFQGSKNDPDYSFKVWQKTSPDCKICPHCNTAIQKNGGCNHMTCRSCNAHFCWLCVQEFPDAQSVHNHQPSCPKRYTS